MRRSVAWIALTATNVFLLCGAPAAAAAGGPFDHVAEIRPAWKARFDGTVRWQRATTGGRLLVATSKGVHGVDPDTGQIVWSHRHLVDRPEAGFQEIAGTSLVVLADGKRKGQIAVLDADDGRMVFDSGSAHFSGVLGHGLVPLSNGLSIIGLKDGGRTTVLAMIDVPNGRMRWENTGALSGGGAVLATMSKVTRPIADVPVVNEAPVEIDAESFLLNTPTGLHRVASRTGQILWTNRDFREMTGMRVLVDPGRPDRCFVLGESRATTGSMPIAPGAPAGTPALYAACGLADGRSLWRQPIRVHGKADGVILAKQGLVVSPGGSRDGTLNLIDAETGKPRWGRDGRGLDTPGGLVDHLPSSEGWVVTTGRGAAPAGGEPDYFLNLLDTDEGGLQFERPVRVRGRLVRTEVLPRALLYVTTGEAGLINPRSGQPVAAPVLSPTGMFSARHEEALYLFAVDSGSLHLVDLKKATIRGVSDRPVRLQEGDVPVALNISGDIVTLVGRNNLVGFELSGRVRFHVHYPAPYDPRIAAPLHRALDAGAAPAPDFTLMAVDLGKNSIGFAKVARSTGAIQGVVRMPGNVVPVYAVDAAAGRLFHRLTPTEIAAYKF